MTTYLTDSRDALSLAGDLQTWLGVELSASIMWDHPTIAALASFMVQEVLPEAPATQSPARPSELR
jgi:acyl carrier protein